MLIINSRPIFLHQRYEVYGGSIINFSLLTVLLTRPNCWKWCTDWSFIFLLSFIFWLVYIFTFDCCSFILIKSAGCGCWCWENEWQHIGRYWCHSSSWSKQHARMTVEGFLRVRMQQPIRSLPYVSPAPLWLFLTSRSKVTTFPQPLGSR